MIFFFKQKTAYEMRISDWSSDVCSSDLQQGEAGKQCRSDQRQDDGSDCRPPIGPADACAAIDVRRNLEKCRRDRAVSGRSVAHRVRDHEDEHRVAQPDERRKQNQGIKEAEARKRAVGGTSMEEGI